MKAIAQSSRFHAALLVVWFLASFGMVFIADLGQWTVAGWPLAFWLAAQGSILIFLGIVVAWALWANRRDPDSYVSEYAALETKASSLINRRFAAYVLVLLVFVVVLAVAEQFGLSKGWVASLFLISTLVLYAGIGIYSRTADAAEYYVAGRRIPAVYNGMAAAADWMSAASFISLAGGLYLQGFSGTGNQAGGVAYILGWTGGFCLVALLVAPYLRGLGLYTVPDFFAKRYGGRWPRILAAWAAVLCSFTYVVAQIYGVGLITSRLTGVQFEIGILLGLGGVLVCSFLGGMRAVTWTQVVQYVIIILAFLIPVSWLSYKQVGNPMAPWAYGQQLEKIAQLEQKLMLAPDELAVRAEYARRADALEQNISQADIALHEQRNALRQQIKTLEEKTSTLVETSLHSQLHALRREMAALPKDASTAREIWSRSAADYRERAQVLGAMPLHSKPFAGDANGTQAQREEYENSRLNFFALVFCLMVGTAGLPHLLTRFYTTPSVAQARTSIAWSVFFIGLLYLSAPALAVLVKYEVMAHLVGQPFDSLPSWVGQWARDPSLLALSDVNHDNILQFAELRLGADVVMLASAEIGGLPYVVSMLVAAGGLAAALSTADGLLLTIGNALAHDMYFDGNGNKLQSMRRVMLSKFALLVVALLAAYVAAQKPAGILYLVTASFSLAGAAFVPAMVLGLFWQGATRSGAVAGMLMGLGLTVYYMLINSPWVRTALDLSGGGLWWGIQPVSAGVFGVSAGILVTVVVSLLTASQTTATSRSEIA
jgi:cation/acetate symporter